MSLEYVLGHYEECYGNRDSYGIRIEVALGRALTDADSTAFYRAADELKEALMREKVRLDPERQREAQEERAGLLSVFPSPIYVEEIPYGYCSKWCCSHRHWYVVTTPKGRIKIGWRKSVINIDWSDSTIKITGPEIAKGDFPTNDKTYIHAYGIDKAKKYVAILLMETEPPK